MFQLAREEHEKFQLAVGRLTLVWADLESALYSVLRYYAKVTDEVGRAIFSGCRARTMMEFLLAIAHNTNMDHRRRSDLDEVFSQLEAINTMRDRVVHHINGSEQKFEDADPSKRYLTNARRVSRKGKEFVLMIGSSDLEAMSEDLLTCCWRLIAHTDNTNNPFVPTYIVRKRTLTSPSPWLYRPPQPIGKPSRNLSSPRSPQRPQKSSPASPRKAMKSPPPEQP